MYVEMILHRLKETWALAIDFSKMFNTLSLAITLQASSYMGLSQEPIEALKNTSPGLPWFLESPTQCGLPYGGSLKRTPTRGIDIGCSCRDHGECAVVENL